MLASNAGTCAGDMSPGPRCHQPGQCGPVSMSRPGGGPTSPVTRPGHKRTAATLRIIEMISTRFTSNSCHQLVHLIFSYDDILKAPLSDCVLCDKTECG